MVTLPLSVTGSAQTGFVTPGYTTIVDQAVDTNSKQNAVSAITGTQAGVDVHSIARPFTVSVARPKQYQVLGKPNPVTGLISNVPINITKVYVRKGMTVLAGQPAAIGYIKCDFGIPAGADIADPANIRAMVSMLIGTLNSVSPGLGDTLIQGVV